MPKTRETKDAERHWKPDDERKTALVRVRLTEAQRAMFEKAAKAAGLEVSTWLREVGVVAARRAGVKA